MLDQVLDFFEIKPDHDLDVMSENQSLFDVVAKVMSGLGEVIDAVHPDLIIVQGDTTTAFLGALAGYYKKVRVAHLEAGLRSGNKYAPWPEELNRMMTGDLADLHFAPTPAAEAHLRAENIHDGIFVTGNTVIDALHLGLSILKSKNTDFQQEYPDVDFNKKIVLLTAHRRESFGDPLKQICAAIRRIVTQHPDVHVIYPVHLNPNVRGPVFESLSDHPGVTLTDPVDYPRMIWLLNHSYLVLTDSGGIQEEAPSLGKPVLVLRDVTERQEGVAAGNAILVGTNEQRIVTETEKLLQDKAHYSQMSSATNPYGDGTTSRQIAEILKQHLPSLL